MATILIEASKDIAAEPSKIYDVLADYEVGHPAILPKQFFSGLDVIEGGRGEGTKIRVYAKSRTFNFDVTEPEPGRVLVETDPELGVSTIFTVDPIENGARVSFETTMRASKGVAGVIERLFAPMMMRYAYRKELEQLADYVSQN